MAEIDPALEAILFTPAAGPGWRKRYRCYLDAGLDLLFPPHCAVCQAPLPGQINKALCCDCAHEILWITRDYCRRCGDATGAGAGMTESCPSCQTYPPRFVEAACTLARYQEGPLRQLILAWKFGRKQHLARIFGSMLAWRLKATGLDQAGLVIVPVPLTPAALKTRGFNQAEELGGWLARELGREIQPRLLRKLRATRPQALLSHAERRENLKDAFFCEPKLAARYKGATVLVLDDVITTTSTVSECARMLTAAGIGLVRAAAVARG